MRLSSVHVLSTCDHAWLYVEKLCSYLTVGICLYSTLALVVRKLAKLLNRV